MTDYNGYVHCGEVFRSPIPSNEKPYLFKCIQCQDIFQFEAFLTHFEQNLCELREITIKEEVIDNGCLGGRSEKGKNEGINSNSIDGIDVNQDSLVFIKDEDVCNADEKDHIRSKIESSDAEVDPEQQEFETDVSLDDDLDLDDDKYDSEDSNVADETEYLVKRKQGKEEETMCYREFVSNYIENHDNVIALIEAYKAQTPLWSKIIRDKEQRQKYLEIVTKELNQKQNLHLHWKQVSTLIRHLRRIYEDDLKQYKDSQQQKITYRTLWFSKHMQFLHSCKLCSKSFYSKSNLIVHLKSHTNVRDYVCKTCGKAFKRASHLKSHENTHSDVRKYVCKTCGKAFKTTSELRKHEDTHSDVRKYVCAICSNSYKQRSTLYHHMRAHERKLSKNKTNK